MHYKFVVIEGNIGAGKTTLATMLAKDYNARLVLENFKKNSYLPKFYKNPEKYAFPLELFFMAERYHQLKKQKEGKENIYKNLFYNGKGQKKKLTFSLELIFQSLCERVKISSKTLETF